MDAKDLDTALPVGTVDQDLPIEASGPQQCRVQNLRPVGRGKQHHPDRGIEAVEFVQQLVESLFLFVMATAAHEAAPSAAECVEFVDEHDGRSALPRLLEKIAHAGRTDAHEHLDEFRSGNGEERHPGLSGDGARQQGLSGSRWTDQQHALGHARTQPTVAGGILQEVDHFPQLLLGLVDPGNVGERCLDVRFGKYPCLALADSHQPTQALTGHRPYHEHPEQQETNRWQDPTEHGDQQARRRLPGKGEFRLGQPVGQFRWNAIGRETLRFVRLGILEGAGNRVLANDEVGNLSLVDQLLELTIGNGFGQRPLHQKVLDQHHRDHRTKDVPEVDVVLALDLHVGSDQRCWIDG